MRSRTSRTGQFVNKNNADCVWTDPITRNVLKHHDRDLEGLGDYILRYYEELFLQHGVSDLVDVGELPFRWQTQYPFAWMGGWQRNQDGSGRERNLLVRIPGRDRSRAVASWRTTPDTAYMYDRFDKHGGGFSASAIDAPGADDNLLRDRRPDAPARRDAVPGAGVSARASSRRCLAVPPDRRGVPGRGTGSVPDVLQWSIEGTLALHTKSGTKDLSSTRIQGVYVLDMIAHNNSKDRDVFQIAPGASRVIAVRSPSRPSRRAWLGTRRPNRGTSSRRGRKPAPAGARATWSRSRRWRSSCRCRARFGFTTMRAARCSTRDEARASAALSMPVVLFMEEDYDIERRRLPRHARQHDAHQSGLWRRPGRHHDRVGGTRRGDGKIAGGVLRCAGVRRARTAIVSLDALSEERRRVRTVRCALSGRKA